MAKWSSTWTETWFEAQTCLHQQERLLMLVGMACEVHINAQKPQRPHADVFLEHIRKFQARTVAAHCPTCVTIRKKL